MVNLITKCMLKVSDIMPPLRGTIKKDVEFHWMGKQEEAFKSLENLLANSTTLQYYDVNKDVTPHVDTSNKGLGAVLYQDKGTVAYASKVMNETQQHYTQIEKELLATAFGCKQLYQYIYGKPVTKETDHKPLEATSASHFTSPITAPKNATTATRMRY